jgi:hypothetical protein
MSKIYTIFILLIFIEIPTVKVNMRFLFLSVYITANLVLNKFVNLFKTLYTNGYLNPDSLTFFIDVHFRFILFQIINSYHGYVMLLAKCIDQVEQVRSRLCLSITEHLRVILIKFTISYITMIKWETDTSTELSTKDPK